jgi:hypothetical protein
MWTKKDDHWFSAFQGKKIKADYLSYKPSRWPEKRPV